MQLQDGGPVARALRETLTLVLAGGRGTRLGGLTEAHSKPAVPFGGKYRIIDFTLSNCINSGLNRICILTQYRGHSLLRHIELGWSISRREFGEFIEVLPAQERQADSSWYQGTADAVYQNLDIIAQHAPRHVLVLAGDHVYKMDYGTMMARHLALGAGLTIGCTRVPLAEAGQFGIMAVGADGLVEAFAEKPATARADPAAPGMALASMGIYLFDADLLATSLAQDAARAGSRHDFGADIIPALLGTARVAACPFVDLASGAPAYWRDVGTLDAYWRASLELAAVTPPLNLYDHAWPIRTASSQLPPAKFVFDDDGRRGVAIDSLVAAGCIVSGATVRRSILSNNVCVEAGATIEEAVILPNARIGPGCRLRRVVVDSDCSLPAGTVVGYDAEGDAARFHRTAGGVVLVTPAMVGRELARAT